MSIQIYISKKNFDSQKADRFFKERRVTVQVMDISPKGKHKLGPRELQLFASAMPLVDLIDREDKKVKEHPACYYDRDSYLQPAILEAPWLLKSPIVRNGNKVTVGYCPEVWTAWLAAEK